MSTVRSRSLRALFRSLSWLLSGEWRPALLIGVVFVAYVLVQSGGFDGLLSDARLLRATACLLIFGVFVGVVFVAELSSQPEAIATRKCTIAGCIAGSAIAFILGAPAEGVALGALGGLVLGYTARWWSQGI